MKVHISILMVLLSVSKLMGQQIPQYRQVGLNASLYNPSAMALQKQASINFSGRWQMLGFGNEPRTLILFGQSKIEIKPKTIFNPGSRIQREFVPIEKKKKIILSHFVGGQIISDNYGAFKFMDASACYALGLPLGKEWRASLGLKMGLRHHSFVPSNTQVLNINDPQLPYSGGDLTYDYFLSNNYQKLSFSNSAGITIHNKNAFISFSAQHGGIPNGWKEQTQAFDPKMHWNGMLGYNFKIFEGLDLQPILIVKKMTPSPYSFELNTMATINYIFFAGLNIQYKSSVGIMAGMEITDNLKMAYSLDFSTNRINKFSNGGHEIFLSYGF